MVKDNCLQPQATDIDAGWPEQNRPISAGHAEAGRTQGKAEGTALEGQCRSSSEAPGGSPSRKGY